MTIAFLVNDEFLKCHSSEYFVLSPFQTIVTDRIFFINQVGYIIIICTHSCTKPYVKQTRA